MGESNNVRTSIRTARSNPRGGVLEVYMTGGGDVFFWVENLHARYYFGSRDLSRIFLGIKKIRVFIWVLSPSELFVSGFHCDQKVLRYLSLVYFWVGNFDARYFFGSKISGLCIFLGLQYEAPSDPPRHVYFEYPPGGQTNKSNNVVASNICVQKRLSNASPTLVGSNIDKW